MKLSENVEVEINEAKASNSRASRMARYSTAAAGVAALSAVDVDAAMIKVLVTDAQNKTDYTLDLSGIVSGASTELSMDTYSLFFRNNKNVSFVNSSSKSKLEAFSENELIGGSFDGKDTSVGIGGTNYYGFRVNQGGGYYNGWLNVEAPNMFGFTINSYGYNSTLNGAAYAGQGTVSSVPDSGPGVVGLALVAAGAAGIRLLRKLRAGK